jgi:hypothetical protein
MSLGPLGRAGCYLTFVGLPLPEGGKFCEKRLTKGKKAFVARTQIVQSSFAIGCLKNAILRAPSITE